MDFKTAIGDYDGGHPIVDGLDEDVAMTVVPKGAILYLQIVMAVMIATRALSA